MRLVGRAPRTCLLALLLTGSGCASTTHARRAGESESDSARGWLALRDGKPAVAASDFARALARDPSDARALFGAANLAYERGDSQAALGHALALIEAAGHGRDFQAMALAPATVARVSRLLAEVPDRHPAEERLLALAPEHLPWQAQYALALIAIDIARKRADEALMAKASARAGCVPSMNFVGSGGRLPLLDLDADTFVPLDRPRPLVGVGCQFQFNAADSRDGIRVMRSEIALPRGRYDIVLDFAGPARLRVDQGPWFHHGGTLERYGSQWSANRIEVAAGKHTIEIRIGTYGSTADLALLALPAAQVTPVMPVHLTEAETVMVDLALGLVANLTGDVEALVTQVERLSSRPRFTLGLAAAARLGESDPTRPSDIMRDKARALWQQALAIDPGMARVWLDLSRLERQNDRLREATASAERARQTAPAWWPAHLALASALRGQGLEHPADVALAAGLALADDGRGACEVLDQAFHRAEDREDFRAATHLADRIGRCDAQDDNPRIFAQRRGELDKALSLLRRALPTSAEPLWLRSEIADLLVAQGHLSAAQSELEALTLTAPRDTRVRIRLADAEAAEGASQRARATLAEALRRFPGRDDVRRAARLAGLALPLDAYRVDGEKVIREYLASGKTYQAPAVVVLDRAVERVFPDGSRLLLTHSITQVLSKDAIESVGEVQVPDGAEILHLRTRKADGRFREAEEIAGKSSISVPDLGVGDFVESETIEAKAPREAFAPGFIGERFYFQSFDAPLDRSEYVLVAPATMPLDVNSRADAPVASTTMGPDGTRVLTFRVRSKPQVFPEPSAVPATEWIPSVRVSSGITIEAWSRFIADRMARLSRGSPELREVAEGIAKRAGRDRSTWPEAIVAWVRQQVEPEVDYGVSATATLARHRGNRAVLILALARSLGVPADLVLARSLLQAEADAPISLPDLDDFRELMVRFPGREGDAFVDPQIRRAPFAYLMPGYDGAPAVVVGTRQVVKAVSGVKNSRSVTLRARLESDGAAKVAVTEQLSGWPAVEWTELLDRAGKDRNKLRQEFEQNWLGQQFPGARLDTLSVEEGAGSAGARVSYTFRSARMAARQGGVLRLRPEFFEAQPGRRFGTEPQRKTALLLGYDIPLDLDAEIALPSGAKVLDVGQGEDVRIGGARFFEQRRVNKVSDSSETISLRRRSRLPIMRVLPGQYRQVAAELRTVDPIERGEIRIAVPGR